jgi:glutamyl-tRNA(Gln) amidotransferase subunit D
VPVAKVYDAGKIVFNKKISKQKQKPKLLNEFEDKTALILVHPNKDPKIIDWYIENDYKGIVLVGTGLGHLPCGSGGLDKTFPTNKNWLPFVEKAVNNNIVVVMSSQCLFGRVNNKVYSNLRFVSKAGAEYLNSHDMLYSVLYIKLALALKRFKTKKEIIKYLETNIAGEISNKELVNSFDSSTNNL